jgi:hypothetical protein
LDQCAPACELTVRAETDCHWHSCASVPPLVSELSVLEVGSTGGQCVSAAEQFVRAEVMLRLVSG